MKQKTMLVMRAIVLIVLFLSPKMSIAQEDVSIADLMQYRTAWKYKQIFPKDVDYIYHMEMTNKEFSRNIFGQTRDSFSAHRLTVVIYNPVYWSAETKSFVTDVPGLQLPVGTYIDQCLFFGEDNHGLKEPIASTQVYKGTAFTLILPDSVFAWDITNGKYGAFTSYGYMHLDALNYALASANPTVNDPTFNGYQPNYNGNVVNMATVDNIRWGIYQAVVPSGGHPKKGGTFDSGVDTGHIDINTYMIDTANSANVPYGTKNFRDSNGHGTAVNALIMATPNNNSGMVGLAYRDTMVIYKVWAGSSMSGPISYVTSATNAAHLCGVKNKNYSLGGTTYDPTFAAAIANGYSNYNSWAVAGAGNTGSFSNSFYPACFPKVWNIVGVTVSGSPWSTSTTSDSAFLGIFAQNVYSAVFNTTSTCNPHNGTSFASPQGFAIMCNLRDYFPDFSYEQIRALAILIANGNGTRTTNKGYGIPTKILEVLESYFLLQDTVNFSVCGGKHRVGALDPRFKWVDSGFVFTDSVFKAAVQNDSVNTKLLPPGTYVVKRWVKSIPDIPGYTTPWYDTVVQVWVGTGTGNTTASTSINNSGSTSVCVGDSRTLTKAGNTTAAKRKWLLNGTQVDTAASYVYTATGGAGTDVIKLVTDLSTTGTCWNKAFDTATVSITKNANITPSVSISANPSGTICSGTSVTFTATPTNGGSTPSYQWKVGSTNVGTNSTTYTSSTLSHNDVVSCVMTPTSGGCYTSSTATSNTITMTVTTPVTPSVSIAANPGNTICSGTNVTFTATPTNGGSPSYQWKVNGTNVGTNSSTYSSSTLSHNDVVSCVVTTSLSCVTTGSATSNTITMTVNSPVTPSVSIAANPGNTICAGTNVVFTATPTNGGSTPSYQWKVNSTNVGTNSSTYSSTALSQSDVVSCVVTSSLTCVTSSTATSNTVSMTVNANIVPNSTATATSPSICNRVGDTINAVCSVTGATVTKWQKLNGTVWADISGTTNGTLYLPSGLAGGNHDYRCIYAMPVGCYTKSMDTTNVETISVTAAQPLTASLAGTDIFVQQGVWKGIYTLTIPTGLTNYSVKWYRVLNGTSSLMATTSTKTWVHDPLNNDHSDTVYAVVYPSGCWDKDSLQTNQVIVAASVSVAALTELPNDYKIYPNPASSQLFIAGLHRGDHMIVTNAVGQQVMAHTFVQENNPEQINVTNLASGVYMLRFLTKEGTPYASSGKLIITR